MSMVAVLIVLCCSCLLSEAAVSDAVYDNCELLGNNRLEVSWTLRRSDGEIDIQLCGCTSDVAGTNEYMGFGLSGNSSRTLMLGADATITYVDDDVGPVATDYYLSAYLQCGEGRGACPDTLDSSGGCTDDVRNVTGFKREGLQCVAYTRSLTSADTCDTTLNPDQPQYIVWAVGGVGATAFKHFNRAESTEMPITFGREPRSECSRGLTCPNCPPFEETVMDATGRNETFVANIGPPGNERGYMAITDQAGWGITWYINATLIPRIVVERGYTYTFVCSGGLEEVQGSNYHPFYITDSRSGGYLRKTEGQQRAEVVYAGFDENGNTIGVGPLCEIRESTRSRTILNTCGPQNEYIQNLENPRCAPSEDIPGRFTWIPDETTPNTVYYQCATHTNLGYEITVIPEITADSSSRVLAYAVTIGLMAMLTSCIV